MAYNVHQAVGEQKVGMVGASIKVTLYAYAGCSFEAL